MAENPGSPDKLAPSPAKNRVARLSCRGEIRFGPRYYSLAVDDLDFGRRLFGDAVIWSEDGRYLAVQEWHNTEEALGPSTSLLILDLELRREASFPAFHGFAEPVSFKGHLLHHQDNDWSTGSCAKTGNETDIDMIDWWKEISRKG